MRSKEPAKLKVILDTSVCVAALLSESGGSAKVLELVLGGKIYTFYTDEMVEEIKRVIQRKKFNLEKEKQEHFIHLLAESSFLVNSLTEFEVVKCRDPKDDIFLSLANQIEADYLISLDMDLLELRKVGVTRIVNPAIFLKQFKGF
jgi:uncharacterized protein